MPWQVSVCVCVCVCVCVYVCVCVWCVLMQVISPDRWLALMEMHLFVAMVIQLFDLQLLDPMPPVVCPIQ